MFISWNVQSQKSTLETSGDVILFTLPVATLTTTFIIGDNDGSWQYVKGLLLNEAITYGLKFTVNKTRPDGSNENSFPSGHTSTTFQSASFVHLRYGFKYSIPAYVLAGFTAFTRLESKRHDGWDVLAGAIIGVGSSYLFTTPYLREHMELTYSSSNGIHLIGFSYTF
jgi:membrane-associated phospholipid phosphatase